MLSVCLYLHAHQPYRVKRYRVFDIGKDHQYFTCQDDSDLNNQKILKKVAEKSLRPTNALLLSLLERHPEFKVSFSLSGTLLDQLASYAPDVLDSFRTLVATGRCEMIADTFYHSLSFFYSRSEFEKQVNLHTERINKEFGVTPRVFRNTELSYTNDLAVWAEKRGFLGVLTEGWEGVLGERSPAFLYRPKGCKTLKLLLKHYRLSDDIAFRFSERSWSEWPLNADTFAFWVHKHHGNGETVNLFMDYETFGEHQWKETGIFDFLNALPKAILSHPNTTFVTPTEILLSKEPVGELDVPHVLSWADT
ncbi:MAG: glycoside hydrolase family 57 protein, partial [bacterium]|nr:glycoside hydrolase family 57 protein [bacterium]